MSHRSIHEGPTTLNLTYQRMGVSLPFLASTFLSHMVVNNGVLTTGVTYIFGHKHLGYHDTYRAHFFVIIIRPETRRDENDTGMGGWVWRVDGGSQNTACAE